MLLDRRQLPLNALRAFEVTGKHCHMRAAAEELGVTHGAVSRQIRQLEEMLDVKLFDRSHNRLTLTSSGARLLSAVTAGFDRITEGALYVDPEEMVGPLHVAATPSIVTNWLLPVIGSFFERYPEIEVRLLRLDPHQTELPSGYDVAITYGRPTGHRLVVDELFHEHFFPVGSPLLLGSKRTFRRVTQLFDYPLLHDSVQSWSDWLISAGVIDERAPRNLYLHDAFQAVNAARRGFGIALADQMDVVEDIRSGTLVRLFKHTLAGSAAVFLVRPVESLSHQKAQLFTSWVLKSVSEIRSRLTAHSM